MPATLDQTTAHPGDPITGTCTDFEPVSGYLTEEDLTIGLAFDAPLWSGSIPASIALGTYTVKLVNADTEELIAGDITIEADDTAYGYQTRAQAAAAADLILPALISAYTNASSTQKDLAREAAADDIDARAYQGRKYDPAQRREFPRVPYDSGAPIASNYYPLPNDNTRAMATEIWDVDDDGVSVIVPLDVRKAEIFQANHLLRMGSSGDRIQAAIDAGLASQSVGGMSESYRESVKRDWGYGLHPRVRALVEKYRRKSGSKV